MVLWALLGAFVLAPCYWLLIPERHRRPFLVLASAAGLAFLDPSLLVLVAFVAVALYGGLRPILSGRLGSPWAVVIPASLGLVSLFVVNKLSGSGGLLPSQGGLVWIGVSYLVLKAAAVMVDAARGSLRDAGFVDLLSWIVFLPTYTGGPIEEFDHFRGQQPRPNQERILGGAERILFGLVKTMLLSHYLGVWVTPVLADPAAHGPGVLLLAVDALERIRITSIEPTTIEPSLVEHMARSEKLCNYFHIPIQSASDTVLENMNRRYTLAEYRDFVERVVDTVPDVGLGTDVIVGFPGETDQTFEETFRFLESLPFAYFHVFSYSKRYGTKAARLDGHVHSHVIKERSQALRRLSSAKRREFASRYLGKSVDVLFEQQDENGLWTGLTSNYLRVGVVSPEPLRNAIESVTIRDVPDETTEVAMGSLNSSAGRTADPSPTPAWETAASQRSAPPRPQ